MRTINFLVVIFLICTMYGCIRTSKSLNENQNSEIDSNTIVMLRNKTMEVPSGFHQIEINPHEYNSYKFQSDDELIKLYISETKDHGYGELLPKFPLKGFLEVEANETLDSILVGERKVYIKSKENGDNNLIYRFILELDGEVLMINFESLLDKKDFIKNCGIEMIKSIK